MSTGRGIGEQQRHVLGADVAPVDPVGRTRSALDPAGNFAFAFGPSSSLSALEQDRDFGEIARRSRGSAGEDNVVHPAAAKRLGTAFAHHPADGFKKVGFAATVRADHSGQPGLDAKLRRLDEAFEAAELEPPDPQI